MNAVYRTAFALAQRGIPVFPCRENGKEPKTGPGGYQNASTDPLVLRRWFEHRPRVNLGIPMGFRSGLFAIDIDRKPGKPDGLHTLVELERELGALPVTLTAETATGGRHIYFRMPARELRNSAKKLGPGVDTRGEGGYVLAPPSVIEGRPYRWVVRAVPAELPAEWVEALAPAERPASTAEPWQPRDLRDRARADSWCIRALQEEARRLAQAPAGSRNDRLWRAAAALGGLVHLGAIDASDVRRALTWACAQWGKRTPSKDAKTLENGLAFGLTHPRHIDLGADRAAG